MLIVHNLSVLPIRVCTEQVIWPSIPFQIPPSQQMIQFKDDFGNKEIYKSGITGANFG